jgi:hypothetical protein
MLVAQARMPAQLRKSPSAARMAEAMARSGKLRCFFTSLPVKIRCSRALVARRIVVTSTGFSAGLAGFADRAAGKQPHRPAGQRGRLAFCELARGFHPLAHVHRASQHHRVELLHWAYLLRREHGDLAATFGQHAGDRLGDLAGRPVLACRADQDLHWPSPAGAGPVS